MSKLRSITLLLDATAWDRLSVPLRWYCGATKVSVRKLKRLLRMAENDLKRKRQNVVANSCRYYISLVYVSDNIILKVDNSLIISFTYCTMHIGIWTALVTTATTQLWQLLGHIQTHSSEGASCNCDDEMSLLLKCVDIRDCYVVQVVRTVVSN